MKQEKIKYKEIMSLGFKEEIVSDSVYYDDFGYDYAIITKKLAKYKFLQWEKDTRLCVFYKTNKDHDIVFTKEVKDIDEVKFIISLFE